MDFLDPKIMETTYSRILCSQRQLGLWLGRCLDLLRHRDHSPPDSNDYESSHRQAKKDWSCGDFLLGDLHNILLYNALGAGQRDYCDWGSNRAGYVGNR